MRGHLSSCILTILAVILFALPATAGRKLDQSKGQKVYVPVYSHVYQGPKNRPYNLSALLSIRNVDKNHSMTVTLVDYYDDHGTMVKRYLETPVVVKPMATKEFYINERNTDGGSGANFAVRWHSESPLTVPIIQAVMIGTASTQGISFVCDGVTIEERE